MKIIENGYEVTARIEYRTWFEDGVYLGDDANFIPDNGYVARCLTGDFYGEWQGTRHFDGDKIISDEIELEVRNRAMLMKTMYARTGDVYCYPVKLSDYGEYRIITTVTPIA